MTYILCIIYMNLIYIAVWLVTITASPTSLLYPLHHLHHSPHASSSSSISTSSTSYIINFIFINFTNILYNYINTTYIHHIHHIHHSIYTSSYTGVVTQELCYMSCVLPPHPTLLHPILPDPVWMNITIHCACESPTPKVEEGRMWKSIRTPHRLNRWVSSEVMHAFWGDIWNIFEVCSEVIQNGCVLKWCLGL